MRGREKTSANLKNIRSATASWNKRNNVNLPLQSHPALYSAFDVYPSAKGAATHIQQAAQTLFDAAGGGLLYVLGNERLPRFQREGAVEILRFGRLLDNYLHRALAYSAELQAVLEGGLQESLQIAQFRDPWGGLPLVRRAAGRYRTIYEVNGLPSVELPMAYPHVGTATLAKIRALEDECLARADRIVVPSGVIRDNLARRGVEPKRVSVIPNGTELNYGHARPEGAPKRYILYFGAVQAWQGLDVLLRALQRLQDIPDLHLVICCSVKSRRAKGYQKLAEKLDVAERITWLHRLNKEELAPWVSNAYVSVAPLTECARNIDQGCCPLKILESMGAGVPVIASDLPVVRELVTHRENGYLVAPERPAELARGLRVLLDYPDAVAQMGAAAQRSIAEGLLWSHANAALKHIHVELISGK
ncbi:glycosyltransferase [Hahella sp. KA22]|nr:glycosyltransferase family 1 protein [Hahella sp. KA22]QAY58302.1 glycosyltransferase [Hahella sp. KA22]